MFSVTRLGDVVLATATFDELRSRYGTLRLITSPAGAALLVEDPRLSEIHVVPDRGPVAWRWKVVRALLAARGRGDAIVDLELYAPRWRLVRSGARLARLETLQLDLPRLRREEREPSTARHVSCFYGDVLGADAQPRPRLIVGALAREQARAALELAGSNPDAPFWVLHPGSHGAWTEKRPPPRLLAAVARTGWEGSGGRVRPVLLGSPEERGLCEEVVDAAALGEAAIVLAGMLPLSAFPAVIERARLFVGGDSGPLKIAEAVGVPTLSFWTVTRPERLAPRGTGHLSMTLGPGRAPEGEVTEESREHILDCLRGP